MSQGKNASEQREGNEKTILDLIRCHKVQSKTDLTYATGLTYVAVARIVDNLEQQQLIRKNGTRKQAQGKPTAIYELNPHGKYVVAIELADTRLRLMVVDFLGVPLHLIEGPMAETSPWPVTQQIYQLLTQASAHMSSDQLARLAGISLIDSSSEAIELLQIKKMLGELLRVSLPHNPSIHPAADWYSRIHIVDRNIAAATAAIALNENLGTKNLLYIAIDQEIDGCLIFHNQVQNHRPEQGRFLANMPIAHLPYAAARNAVATLNDLASLGSLARVLFAGNNPLSGNISSLIQGQPKPSAWLTQCAQALAIAIESCASIHQLDEVLIASPMPTSWQEEIVNKIAQQASLPYSCSIRYCAPNDQAALTGSAVCLLTQ